MGHGAGGGVIGDSQDAVTGIFLSTDPSVSDPYNTQDHTRHTYVYNSPLSNVDPSGFDCSSPGSDPDDNGVYDVNNTTGSGSSGDGGAPQQEAARQRAPQVREECGGGQDLIDPAAPQDPFNVPSAGTPAAAGSGALPPESGDCAAIARPVVQAAAYVDAQDAQLQATLASPFNVNLPIPGLIGLYGTDYPAAIQGNFACGSYKCSYEMGPFSTPDDQTGAWIGFSVGGLGDGQCVQTWSDSTEASDRDCLAGDCPFYPSYASTGQWFIDDPARPSQNVTWVGQTSYVLPYAAGAAFTIQCGYTMSNGTLSYIPPVLATPWPTQQLQIRSANHWWHP